MSGIHEDMMINFFFFILPFYLHKSSFNHYFANIQLESESADTTIVPAVPVTSRDIWLEFFFQLLTQPVAELVPFGICENVFSESNGS